MGFFSDPATSSVNNSSNHDNSLSSLETTPSSEPEPRRAVGRTKSSRRRRRRLGGNLNLTMLLGESRPRNKSANDLTRIMAATEADEQTVQPTRQRPSRRKSTASTTMGGSSGTHTTAAGGGGGVSSRRRGSLFGGVMNESMTASSFWNGNRGGMDESSHRNHSNNHSSLSLDEYLDEMESFARLIKEADPQQRDRIFRMVSRKE